MAIYSTPLVRSHQSTVYTVIHTRLSGSFGLVRPAWIYYTRSAVPQDVDLWTPQVSLQSSEYSIEYTLYRTHTAGR